MGKFYESGVGKEGGSNLKGGGRGKGGFGVDAEGNWNGMRGF